MSDIEILELPVREVAASLHEISDGIYHQHEDHGFDIDNEGLRYFVFEDPENGTVDYVFAVRVNATIEEFVKDLNWWVLQGTHWPYDGLPAAAAVFAYGDWNAARYLNIEGLSGSEPDTFAAELSTLFERLAIVFKEINCTGVV
jgi:hypothetical protein